MAVVKDGSPGYCTGKRLCSDVPFLGVFTMTRAALALLFVVAANALAEDKPIGQPITEVKLGQSDKFAVKPGAWSAPSKITTMAELKELVSDEATRATITKAVDFKTHDLLVFCWQGSGGDQLDYAILESFPEQVPFKLIRGKTKDLRTHTKLFAVRKNVKWSTK